MKRSGKKILNRAYIYLVINTSYRNWNKERFDYWGKNMKRNRACRAKYEVETKRKNIIRVKKWVCEIFTVTHLQFMYTDERVMRHLNENMILRNFNSFAFTSIAIICCYLYSQIILNLTHLQKNFFLYIYISGTILRLAKSDCVFHLFGLVLDSNWVLSDTKSSPVWCNNQA